MTRVLAWLLIVGLPFPLGARAADGRQPAQPAPPAARARPVGHTEKGTAMTEHTAETVTLATGSRARPPFAYFGGKTTMAPRIASLLPDHRHYVEPFAGSLAVLLAKSPSKLETVNDIDGDLMLFWRVLRDRTEELVCTAALTPHGRDEHQAAYDLEVDDELERARRVWVLLSQGRSGTMRRTGWRFFANPAGTGNAMPEYLDAYLERMPPAAARLRRVSLESRPALDVIRDYGQHPEVCLYVDPPYEGVTRPKTYDGYRHEMRATDDHRELAEALNECKASVVLSGYHSPLYDEMYGSWERIEISAFTGQGRGERADRNRVEVLWSNRTIGEAQLFAPASGEVFA